MQGPQSQARWWQWTERRLGAAGRLAVLASRAVAADAAKTEEAERYVIGYILTGSLLITATLAVVGLKVC